MYLTKDQENKIEALLDRGLHVYATEMVEDLNNGIVAYVLNAPVTEDQLNNLRLPLEDAQVFSLIS